jgi:hypothetical protein
MSISSRKQLLEEADNILKSIREASGVDDAVSKLEFTGKVATAVKKIHTAHSESGDVTQALIELAKLLKEKKCQNKLEAVKEIEKAEEGTPYHIAQYKMEVEKCLLDIAREELTTKEYGAVITALQ